MPLLPSWVTSNRRVSSFLTSVKVVLGCLTTTVTVVDMVLFNGLLLEDIRDLDFLPINMVVTQAHFSAKLAI